MASISIHDLHSTGADFFADSETYMHELSDAELAQQGGIVSSLIIVPILTTISLLY